MSIYTIKYKGFTFEYDLYYQPEEKADLEYGGCDEDFEITNITLNGIDADDLMESQYDDFCDFAIQDLKNN